LFLALLGFVAVEPEGAETEAPAVAVDGWIGFNMKVVMQALATAWRMSILAEAATAAAAAAAAETAAPNAWCMMPEALAQH